MVEMQRTVDTPQGPIAYTLTVKPVKNMNLRLEGDGTVRVSVNRRVPYAAADAFIRSRAAWIRRGREQLARRGEPIPPPDRETALQSLTWALDRVLPLVEPLGVARPALQVRYMTSRWGSCHWTRGYITLNTALARCPEELRDYVALHELVHFLHPDHGPGFYAVMDRLMPDWKEKRARLRGCALQKP